MKGSTIMFGVGVLCLGAITAYSLVSQASANFTEGNVIIYKAELSQEQREEMTTKLTTHLDEKLANGEITQVQYDEMITNLQNMKFSGKVKGGFIKEGKVELTDEQKAEIMMKMVSHLAEKLANGEITQEQYHEMVTKMESGEFHMVMKHRGEEKGFSHSEFTGKKDGMMIKMMDKESFPEGEFITKKNMKIHSEEGSFPVGEKIVYKMVQ